MVADVITFPTKTFYKKFSDTEWYVDTDALIDEIVLKTGFPREVVGHVLAAETELLQEVGICGEPLVGKN